VVGRDGPHQEIVPNGVRLFRHASALAPHRLVVALATCRRAAGLVALGAVRLGVVKRVVELGRL